jgi:hypothetical protein
MSRPSKRRAVEDPRQTAFTFDVAPVVDTSPGALAGLDRRISGFVSRVLKEYPRPREVAAAEMSALLAEDVSKAMLDQYAAPSAEAHNISAARLLALLAAVGRPDLLDTLTQAIGARVLCGDEFWAARLGSLEAQKRNLEAEIRTARLRAVPIRGTRA